MANLKNLIFVFLLLSFSICVNEVNEVKNSFAPNSINVSCNNGVGAITLAGNWDNSQYIPESLDFNINFKDGSKVSCSFKKQPSNSITCPISQGKYSIYFDKQFMDSNNEYVLKASKGGIDYNCIASSSLYIYSNLLLLFVIIFILFY